RSPIPWIWDRVAKKKSNAGRLVQVATERKHFHIEGQNLFPETTGQGISSGETVFHRKGLVLDQFDIRMVPGISLGGLDQFFILIKASKDSFKGWFVHQFHKFLPIVIDSLPDTGQGPWIGPPESTGDQTISQSQFDIEIR